MLGEPQLTALLAGLVLLHLLVFTYAVWRNATASGERATGGRGADGEDVLVCPECDTGNEPEYRYCRGCATELPGSASVAGASRPVGDGNVL